MNTLEEQIQPLPRLEVQLNGQLVHALLDTGASKSFVSAELLHPDEIPVTYKEVRLASGQQLRARGPVALQISLNGQRINLQAYVLPAMQERLILGQEWMIEEQATLDFQHNCVYFGTTYRQSAYWTAHRDPQKYAPPVHLTPENVPEARKEFYETVLNEFPELFQENLRQPTTRLTTHVIRLKDKKPFKIQRYRYSPQQKSIIQQEIAKMLAAGVIRRSHSAFCSPIVIVQKKDGKNRFCVDYRQLNAQTEDEVAQLPPIRETLHELGPATVFTSLDLRSGYWQVPVDEASVPYTAFSAPDGATYEFLVMPFGLKCAPSTFQKLMTEVLAGYIDNFVKVYLDDIIIYSTSHEEHQHHLRLVLERLRTHGLRCSLEKCHFGADALDYLGYRVTAHNNRPQEKHVLQVRNFPRPTTMKELQSFLGTANWLREYVPDFAALAAPLTGLVGKKHFRWTDEAEVAFENLKEALAKPLTLSRPDPRLPFHLQTDASMHGMGAVVYQITPEGERRIISCASAKFTATEQKYHCNEQETLCVVWACKRYRALLGDRQFTLVTDSRALSWLDKYKDDRAKLTRWALLLQEYNFKVQHCPGKSNQLPDYLSRNPGGPEYQTEEISEERLLPPEVPVTAQPLNQSSATPSTARHTEPSSDKQKFVVHSQKANSHKKPRRKRRVPLAFVQPTTITVAQVEVEDEPATLLERIKHAQADSVEYQATRARWQRMHDGEEDATQPWQRTLRDDYTVRDGLIWFTRDDRNSLVVPQQYWQRVIHHYHDEAGHPGRDETIAAIRRLYHWPAMTKQVKTYVRHCLICASIKRGGALQPNAPLHPRPPTRPWQVVSFDVMGPYAETRNKNRFLLVLTDTFSKWVEIQAVPTTGANTIVRFLTETFHRWGFPERIITDNGPQFRSLTWQRFLRRHDITGYTSPVYHQRANPVERRNQEIKKALRLNTRDQPENRWDEGLTEAIFNLHTRRNAATGMSPSQALLGAPLVKPGEWAHPVNQEEVHNNAREREARIQQVQRRQQVYARNLFPVPREAQVHFHVGDQVLVRTFPGTSTALSAPWSGPFPVVTVLGDNTYEVDRNGSQFPIHVDDLRPAPVPLPEPQEDEPGPDAPDDDASEPPSSDDEIDPISEASSQPQGKPAELRSLESAQAEPSQSVRHAVTIEDCHDDSEDPQPISGEIAIIGLWP